MAWEGRVTELGTDEWTSQTCWVDAKLMNNPKNPKTTILLKLI